MVAFTLDLNGGSVGNNNSTTYNDAPASNTPVLIWPTATIDTGNNDLANRLSTLVLRISNPSATMQFSLAGPAQTAATAAGVSLTFNSETGDITLQYTGTGDRPDAPTWNTILQGLQYNNTADAAAGTSYTIAGASATPASGTYDSITYGTETIGVVCFYAGTLIATPSGQREVETLRRGDLVVTTTGAVCPMQWLGRQTVSTIFDDPLRVLPIRIKAGALDNNLPQRDLLVSPDHALLIGDILVQAGALVNGLSIVREDDVPATFTYYHVELADHSLVMAEGVPAETFVDNVERMAFDNWDEHEALYPEGAPPIPEMELPRAKSHRQVPRAIRQRLMARATAVFSELEQAV